MDDQTIGPVLTWTTAAMLEHVEKLKKLPGASVAFGGRELEGHTIPERYGAIQPTAVFVPLAELVKPENFDLVTTEVFGPLQVLSAQSTYSGHRKVRMAAPTALHQLLEAPVFKRSLDLVGCWLSAD